MASNCPLVTLAQRKSFGTNLRMARIAARVRSQLGSSAASILAAHQTGVAATELIAGPHRRQPFYVILESDYRRGNLHIQPLVQWAARKDQHTARLVVVDWPTSFHSGFPTSVLIAGNGMNCCGKVGSGLECSNKKMMLNTLIHGPVMDKRELITSLRTIPVT